MKENDFTTKYELQQHTMLLHFQATPHTQKMIESLIPSSESVHFHRLSLKRRQRIINQSTIHLRMSCL